MRGADTSPLLPPADGVAFPVGFAELPVGGRELRRIAHWTEPMNQFLETPHVRGAEKERNSESNPWGARKRAWKVGRA